MTGAFEVGQFDELREIVMPMLRPYFSQVAVFGSVARGEAEAASDLDLLVRLRPVESRPSIGLLKWVALEQALRAKLGRPVELVSEQGLSPYVRPYVERDKVVIYDEVGTS